MLCKACIACEGCSHNKFSDALRKIPEAILGHKQSLARRVRCKIPYVSMWFWENGMTLCTMEGLFLHEYSSWTFSG